MDVTSQAQGAASLEEASQNLPISYYTDIIKGGKTVPEAARASQM